MDDKPLMPKATAVWLVDNTSLTFQQIADFCGLHPLEVKGIADGEVAQGIKGMDPVAKGEITREQLDAAQADPKQRLKVTRRRADMPEPKKRKGPRYTPVSRRQDRPDAIKWLVRYHPELSDAQICKLVGTTKPTINAIRDNSHWNASNLTPRDPVTLGLCTQIELDEAVRKAAGRRAKTAEQVGAPTDPLTVRPADETVPPPNPAQKDEEPVFAGAEKPYSGNEEQEEREKQFDPEAVFASLTDKKPDDAGGEDGEADAGGEDGSGGDQGEEGHDERQG
jgi:hypothetical protein